MHVAHTHTHTHTHTHIDICIHTHTHTHMHSYMQRNIAVGVGTELLFRDQGAGTYLSYYDMQKNVRVVSRVMPKISAVTTTDFMNDAGVASTWPHMCFAA